MELTKIQKDDKYKQLHASKAKPNWNRKHIKKEQIL